jgi:hypothetical protein
MGHFEFTGPTGSLGSSQTKFWTTNEQARLEVNQPTSPGDLWCTTFVRSSGEVLEGPICVTA